MVALQLSDRTHPSQSPQLQSKLNAKTLLKQVDGGSPAPLFGGGNNFMENVQKMIPWAGANAALKPANFFQPKMWQDMADAIQKSEVGDAKEGAEDIMENVMELATGGLLGKNRKRSGITSLIQTEVETKKS